jgi:SAM-dependent methyltransferase
MSLEKYKRVIHKDFSKSADFIDRTIKSLNLDKKSEILDIGTGFGAMAILLAINGFNVITGQPKEDPQHENHHSNNHVDHHHDRHNNYDNGSYSYNWKENARALGVEEMIKFQFLNAESLPFPDESFDCIFMYDTLQHVGNKKLAINECIRVMKPEGLAVIIEWNEKAIEIDFEKYGYKINFIDPRKYLEKESIITDLIKGNLLNIYVLRNPYELG